MRKFLALFGLVITLFLAGFFRFEQINNESLWLDEGITYYYSNAAGYPGIWDRATTIDQSPPGYYFLTYPYHRITGENEFAFRFLPIIFGLISIVVLYRLLTNMFNRGVGLIAAILLSISAFHIGFSIENRMYVLLSLESLLAFSALYKAMRHENYGVLHWFSFTIFTIAGLYTHNFYMFAHLALGFVFITLLFDAEERLKKILMGFLSTIAAFLAFLPWIPSLLHQLSSVERYWMAPNSLSDIKDYLADFTQQNPYLFWTFIILSATAVITSFFNRYEEEYKKELVATISLALFFIIGLLTPLAYSILHEPILKIRYVVFLLPIFLSLVAIGIYYTSKLNRLLPIPIILVIIIQSTPWLPSPYPTEIGEDFRGFIAYAKSTPAPVIVHSPSVVHVLNFYNRRRLDIFPFPYTDDLREYNIDKSHQNKFNDLAREFDSFYLITTHSHENPGGLLRNWSNELCLDETTLNFQGMEAFHYSNCEVSRAT